jgi:hypothetical protein
MYFNNTVLIDNVLQIVFLCLGHMESSLSKTENWLMK